VVWETTPYKDRPRENERMKIEKSAKIGFCHGVRRAIESLEKVARERGEIESLGEVVHNELVMRRLTQKGVMVTRSVDDIRGKSVVLSAHGATPEVMDEIKSRKIEIIDTTCPFVQRAQSAARKLAEADYFVIIFGDPDHAEVKGILGWAYGKGIATTDDTKIASLTDLPRRIGFLSQTTQIPSRYLQFIKKSLDKVYTRDSEIQIIDTICHDIRDRQIAALEVAKRVDLMLVIGGKNSANTRHLAELCGTAVETHQVISADDLDLSWFIGKDRIGITTGSSTADETVDEVIKRLEKIAKSK